MINSIQMIVNYKVGERVIFNQPFLFQGDRWGTIVEIEDGESPLVATSYAIKDDDGFIWKCVMPNHILRFH